MENKKKIVRNRRKDKKKFRAHSVRFYKTIILKLFYKTKTINCILHFLNLRICWWQLLGNISINLNLVQFILSAFLLFIPHLPPCVGNTIYQSIKANSAEDDFDLSKPQSHIQIYPISTVTTSRYRPREILRVISWALRSQPDQLE